MTTESQLSLTVHDELPRDLWLVVDTGLGEANDVVAPFHEVQPLSSFARFPSGEVIDGAIGRTWGICCELQQLWVQAEYRRRGIGTPPCGLPVGSSCGVATKLASDP